jgi:hypothetical protein
MLGHESCQLRLEDGEDPSHLLLPQPLLELVEHGVVRLEIGIDARRDPQPEVDHPLEPRPECWEVVLLARPDPRVVRLRLRLCHLRGERGRNLPHAFPVALRHAHEARVVVVGREARGIGLELCEELADAVLDLSLVDHRGERAELGAPRVLPARRHPHLHVPLQDVLRALEIGDRPESFSQLAERRRHHGL